jgi:hypothetical protein
MVRFGGPRRRLQEKVDAVPFWWHTIDLGHGVATPGHKSAGALRHELDAMALLVSQRDVEAPTLREIADELAF